jgi:hypothetical protein
MSITPRTDEVLDNTMNDRDRAMALSAHCKQLEVELSAALQRHATLRFNLTAMMTSQNYAEIDRVLRIDNQ